MKPQKHNKGRPVTDFSILICTRNRADKLQNTLASVAAAIAHAPSLSVEVLLVDNGSTDNTSATIAQWAASVPFPVKNIFEKTPGLSAARNAGIRAATGNVVAFTDDDCTLNPDYLTTLARYYAADTTPTIRGGKVELGDPTDIPYTILLCPEPKKLQSPISPSGFIIGANMAIPQSVLHSTGFFDERFGAGAPFKAGEESDYIYRAYRAGTPVEYVPDLIVQHFHGRKDKAAIHQLSQGYFLGGGAMFAKHLTDRFLLRHLYWDIKGALRAWAKGETIMDKDLNITYRDYLCATFRGMALYGKHRLCGAGK